MPEGFVFKLCYKGGLTYLPIALSTEKDMHELNHVHFLSPGVWDPDEENDDQDDIEWFDTTDIDPDALDEEEYWDSRQSGWIQHEDKLTEPSLYLHDKTPMLRAVNHVEICLNEKFEEERNINNSSVRKKPLDYEALQPRFAWKPIEIILKKEDYRGNYAVCPNSHSIADEAALQESKPWHTMLKAQ